MELLPQPDQQRQLLLDQGQPLFLPLVDFCNPTAKALGVRQEQLWGCGAEVSRARPRRQRW